MRRCWLWTLVVLMSFSGARVVCLDSPVEPGDPVAELRPVPDCERLCPLHREPSSDGRRASPSDRDSGSDCVVAVDGATMILVVSTAVPVTASGHTVPVPVGAARAESPRHYVEPALAHIAPPPKQHAG
jgi:hypothetical protein